MEIWNSIASLLVLGMISLVISSYAAAEMVCPICGMVTNDFGYNNTWFLSVQGGQRVYTCGMNDGLSYNSTNEFSHPSLLAATMNMYIAESEDRCDSHCMDGCLNSPIDPITNETISPANSSYICLKYGQKIYFKSNVTKNTYLNSIKTTANYAVLNMTCNAAICPDSFQASINSSSNSKRTPIPSSTDIPAHEAHPFCTGSTAMLNGFQFTQCNACVKLFFQPWILDSRGKYVGGVFGAFFIGMIAELISRMKENFQRCYDRQNVLSNIQTWKNKGILVNLYLAHIIISYFAMLVAMTYDTGLFGAILAGFGFGFLCFRDVNEPFRHQTEQLLQFHHSNIHIFSVYCGTKMEASCWQLIELVIRKKVEEIKILSVDVISQEVHVQSSAKAEEIIALIESAGYSAELKLL